MHSRQSVPWHFEERINRELPSDERIRWMERPIPRWFTRSSIGPFLFGIPWTAFAVFWMAAASEFKAPDFSKGGVAFFPLFGIPFVLIGLAMLSYPCWAHRKMCHTVYAITNKRAVIFEFGRSLTVRGFPPEVLRAVYRRERQDGTGDVLFGGQEAAARGAQNDELGFLHVSDPQAVEEMLADLVREANEAPTE